MNDLELLASQVPAGATTPVVIEYLDLDHDGVPDAVRIHRAVPYDHVDGPGVRMVGELATSIGIDGVPNQIRVEPLA